MSVTSCALCPVQKGTAQFTHTIEVEMTFGGRAEEGERIIIIGTNETEHDVSQLLIRITPLATPVPKITKR